MRIKLLLAVMLLPVSTALSASFDCQKASTRVERLICDDGVVGRLDSQLDAAYRIALAVAYPTEKPDLVAAQKTWLKSVRDPCDSVECLVAAYSDRIRVLTLVRTDTASAEYVVDQQELARQEAAFASTLRRIGLPGKLGECKFVVRLLDRGDNGRDASYGAICTWNEREIMVCDDTMVGKLTLKMYGYGVSGRTLADFTQANCPPGG